MPVAAVCYLPGRWNNDIRWARDDPGRDPRTGLGARGLPVTVARYRTSQLQGSPEALARCGTRDLLDDVAEALSGIETGVPVVLVGYSLGASLACLAALEFPPVAGLVLLDGGLAHEDTPPLASLPGGVNGLLSAPSWDARFRRQGLDALGDGWDSATVRARYPLLPALVRDADQLRYLLYGVDQWWPAGQIREIAALAGGGRLHAVLAGIDVPVLGVCSGVPSPSSRRCARTVEQLCRNGCPSTVHRLPADWSHVDVVSHPETGRVWDLVARWIHDNIPAAAPAAAVERRGTA